MKLVLMITQELRVVILLSFIFIQIISAKDTPDEKALVTIGDKKISVTEFRERNDLTIKPARFKDKDISLNNLISEKILALEAEQSGNEFISNPVFEGKIKGIKEQLMRDQLFNEAALVKVVLDTNEVFKKYQLSMREYDVEFFVLGDSERKRIEEKLRSKSQLSHEFFNELTDSSVKNPEHHVKYLDHDDDIITEALYAAKLDTGDVIGPLKITNGDYIIMKVKNWTDYPLFSSEDQKIRWNKVEERMQLLEAGKLWKSFANEIMGNKKIEFIEENLNKLVGYAYKQYIRNNQNDSLNIQVTEIPLTEPEIDLADPLFKIDNKVWTIGDFKKELLLHRLIYRTKNLTNKNFNKQFQLAILDLMRDHYLTKEAYSRFLDTSPGVINELQMWKDSYTAIAQQRKIIDSAIEQGVIDENSNSEKLAYWESYLENLQKKYSNKIRVNYQEYDRIQLTNVDLLAVRPGVPYPFPVPNFPVFIESGKIDYANVQ